MQAIITGKNPIKLSFICNSLEANNIQAAKKRKEKKTNKLKTFKQNRAQVIDLCEASTNG